MEEAGRGEEEGEEEEEESPNELEPEEEEIAMATGCWRIGVSVLFGFGGGRVCREEEPIRGEIK